MTDEQKTARRQDWRLPDRLVEDCADGAGLPKRLQGPTWGDNLRALLTRWAKNGATVEYDPTKEGARMRCMYIPNDVIDALEAEAKRLTASTKKRWTAAGVARLVWEQARGR